MISGAVSIGLCPWKSEEYLILCIEPNDYGNDNFFMSCPTESSFSNSLVELLSNPIILKRMQTNTLNSVYKHSAIGWSSEMDKVYDQIFQMDRIKR